MNTIKCTRCDRMIDTGNHRNLVSVYCPNCRIRFEPTPEEQTRIRKRSYIDSSLVDIEQKGDRLRVSFPWKKNYFLILFAIAWNIMAFCFTSSVFLFRDTIPVEKQGGAEVYLIVAVHAIFGIGLAYGALSSMLNRTIVVVEGGMLKTFCTPLPWITLNQEFRQSSIRQLYVMVYPAYARRVSRDKTIHYRYELIARTTSGNRIPLMEGIDSYERAVSIEAALEEALGITDAPDPHEHEHEV